MSEDLCIFELEVSVEDKLGVLIAHGLVTSANSMPIRIINVSNQLVNRIAGIKVGDLLPIETNKQQLCLTTISKQHISTIIDSFVKDGALMLLQNKINLAILLLKY